MRILLFRRRFVWLLFSMCFLLVCTACQFATMGQIRSAVKDGYVEGYLQKGVNDAKIKKLRGDKKWLPYKLDCSKGNPKSIKGQVKIPCRLGDSLEDKFEKLLSSCGIGKLFDGKITTIPKLLQDNLALRRKVKAFDGVSIFRLFRFVFIKDKLEEFTQRSTETKRFLQRFVLGTDLHVSSAQGFTSASYRQTCNSLVQAGIKLGVNFQLVTLKSAIKSQFNSQGFRELLVFQGLFTSPLHKALELPDEDPNRWLTRMQIWLAYKRLLNEAQLKGPIRSFKYLKSLVGVATFETQRSSRKTQLKASASGKGDVKFVKGSANIKAEYTGGQRFEFKNYGTLVFRHPQARGEKWQAEFDNLPNPKTIRDELQAKSFPITPNASFLVPEASYKHELLVKGMPVVLCNKYQWKLVDCTKKGGAHEKIRKRVCTKRKRGWLEDLKLEKTQHTKRTKGRPYPACKFNISYKTKAPKSSGMRYFLNYMLVGQQRAQIGDLSLRIHHESAYDLNVHPLLRVDKSLTSLKPELIDSVGGKAALRWNIPIEVEDAKNTIKILKKPRNFKIVCSGKRKLESKKQLLLKKRPKRLELSFDLKISYKEKSRIIRGQWNPDACKLEFTVKFTVEESRSRSRKRRRKKKRGKRRVVERIIRTHFLYPAFKTESMVKEQKAEKAEQAEKAKKTSKSEGTKKAAPAKEKAKATPPAKTTK